MTFPIIPSNSASGIYSIDNSLRFNDNDSAYLNRTPSSASNRTTWTWSAWIKRSAISTGNYQTLWNAGSGEADDIRLTITNNDQIIFGTDATTFFLTSQRLRDVSAWLSIVFAFDTTQGTASDRAKLYINGSLVSSFSTDNRASLSGSYAYNNTVGHGIGRQALGGSAYFDGYMAEINFIDGQQLSPTDFGEFDEDSGIWKPKKYTGTYGTNGFYLDFENSGSLGTDQSGNGNNWTPTNLASTDQVIDSPTNNFATLNAVSQGTLATLSEGNLKYTNPSVNSGDLVRVSTQAFSTGKWYAEFYRVGGNLIVGIQKSDYDNLNKKLGEDAEGYGFFVDGRKVNNNTFTSYGSAWSVGDVVGIAYDADLGTLEFYVNGVSQGNAFTGLSGEFVFATGNNSTSATNGIFNFGQDSSFAGNETRQNNSDGNGYGNLYYAPPTGFNTLCTQNLATELSPTIDDGSQYFNTVLYTGNGGTQSITGVGFQPDWTWIKERSSTSGHEVYDSTRGATKLLSPNTSDAEGTNASALTSFDSDGFSVGSGGAVNENSQTYVGWNWLANGGTTSSNTDGSITSTVQANTTAGFSIVTYTGNGTAGATIGHGLGVQPSMIIVKSRTSADPWPVYHHQNTSAPETDVLILSATDATADNNTYWNDTAPTSSVYSVGTSGRVNRNTTTYVAYCFAEIEGYSKFGSYTGNGSTDGTFVYTGFRPSFVLTKRTDTGGYSWGMADSKRSPYNQANEHLFANASDAEYTTLDKKDLLSNGFKHRTNLYGNLSGGTYIYLAIAENPFVSSSGVPVVAR